MTKGEDTPELSTPKQDDIERAAREFATNYGASLMYDAQEFNYATKMLAAFARSLAGSQQAVSQQEGRRPTDEMIRKHCSQYVHPFSRELERALLKFRDNGYLSPAPVPDPSEALRLLGQLSDLVRSLPGDTEIGFDGVMTLKRVELFLKSKAPTVAEPNDQNA